MTPFQKKRPSLQKPVTFDLLAAGVDLWARANSIRAGLGSPTYGLGLGLGLGLVGLVGLPTYGLGLGLGLPMGSPHLMTYAIEGRTHANNRRGRVGLGAY